jgi:sterol desaturase/sphingolipid hydroxylase (fatty acid hydroxylase superfamily)
VPPTVQGLVIGFAVLIVAFRVLQFLRPRDKRMPVLRRGFWTDLAYWGFTPLVTRAITRFSVIGAVVPVAWLIYGKVDKELLLNGFGPASRLPIWAQAISILVLGDFVGYWMHRASTADGSGASTPFITPPPTSTGCRRCACTPSTMR